MTSKQKKFFLLCLFLISIFLFTGILGSISHSHKSPDNSSLMNKLGPNLRLLISHSNNINSDPIRIIVVFENRLVMDEAIPKIKSLSERIQFIREWSFISAAIFSSPTHFIENIAQFSEVQRIWSDITFSITKFWGRTPDNAFIADLNEPSINTPLSTSDVENFTEIYNGTNVIIALLDTGVDITHPDLKDGSILAFGGVSLVEGEPIPFIDLHGHGTFCAGLITGNGVQDSKYKGVAPGASILNIKVLSSLGIGLWSWIISGIEHAIVHGADIIAMCFSMPGYPGDPVNLAIDAAIKRGMIVTTAVGDEGPAYSSVSAPGMTQGAITVGAFNDITQQVAFFSGRGSTLSFHSKPDILASGVNITSCRPVNNLSELLPGELPINLTDLFPISLGYGRNISDYYTTVNSTSAAAANVTGLVASLLQHSKFLTAEDVKIILQTTATPLSGVGPNVQGAGLINITNAHSYIVENNLNNSLVETRLYTPSLFSPGYVVSQNSTRNSTLLVTPYGSLFILIDAYQTNISTHLIQGQFAIKYDNQIKYLSDMYVLRELHNLTANFSIMQSVITDHSLIIVFTIEGLSVTSGFRVNLTIINLEPSPIQNITVFSNWNTDLFWNQSAPFTSDVGEYNSTDDIIFVHDDERNNSPYIGFSGMNPSSGYEINSSAEIWSQINDGKLQSNTNLLGNASIAMEWYLTSMLNSSKYVRHSQIIGIGDSYNTLNNSIQAIKNYKSNENMTNLAVLSSNLSRIGFVGQPYTSNALIINLGNVPLNNTFTAFIINSTEEQTQTFFSKYTDLGRLEPFDFRWLNVTWNPTDVDIYSLYWITGTESNINEIILYIMNISQIISEEQNFLDNFFARNIFIKNNNHKLHSLFPKNIPIAPQLVYFPNDVAIFNISVITNHPLTNFQVLPLEGNLSLDWISYNFPIDLQNYGSIQITITIPHNPNEGFFYRRLNVTSDTHHIGELWVNFSIQYPSGRILFYKPTFNLSAQGFYEITNLFSIWNERLDTVYSGYFEFYNLCLQNNYDVDDFGLLKQLSPNMSLDTIISLPFELPYPTSTLQQNSSYLSNYDLVILCDPEINLTQEEIDALVDFGHNGGNLFFWAEPDFESEHYSINSVLNPFGIQINNSISTTSTQNFLFPSQHEISFGLTGIQLHSFVTFQNLSALTIFTEYSNEPTLLLNESFGKVLCIGDSSLFNDTLLHEADNLPFINQSINWLLKEKINISIIINQENASEPLRINQHLSITMHLTSINGTDLTDNLTLLTYLITPSNRTLYMIFFYVQDGWYNTIYLDEWLNETGTYFLVIYANNPSQVSSYFTQELTLEDALPVDEDPTIDRPWATDFQILLGIIIAFIITNIIMGIFFYQRRQWHRKMKIVELKEKMQREISNLLSEYQLYVNEIDELLKKPKIRDPDKLRMILDMQERKQELLNKLKKLGKKV